MAAKQRDLLVHEQGWDLRTLPTPSIHRSFDAQSLHAQVVDQSPCNATEKRCCSS